MAFIWSLGKWNVDNLNILITCLILRSGEMSWYMYYVTESRGIIKKNLLWWELFLRPPWLWGLSSACWHHFVSQITNLQTSDHLWLITWICAVCDTVPLIKRALLVIKRAWLLDADWLSTPALNWFPTSNVFWKGISETHRFWVWSYHGHFILRGEKLNYNSCTSLLLRKSQNLLFLAPEVQWALKVYRVCSIHVFFKCFERCPYLVCHVTTMENV